MAGTIGWRFQRFADIAEGKIYVVDHAGSAHVFLADASKTLISKNTLEEGCRASPVAVGKKLLLRTSGFLYCIEEAK